MNRRINIDELNLRGQRERAGLTQADMAARLGKTQGQISRMEGEPEKVSVGDLRAWMAICGVISVPERGLDLGDPYAAIQAKVESLAAALASLGDPEPFPEDLVRPMEAAQGVLRLARRPLLSVVGRYDAGKSTVLNTLTGKRVLPARFAPTTSLLIILNHIDRRPVGLGDECYILGSGFDANPSPSRDEINAFLITSGSSDILGTYAQHGDDFDSSAGSRRKAPEPAAAPRRPLTIAEQIQAHFDGRSLRQPPQRPAEVPKTREVGVPTYAFVYLDADILRACTLVDAPGLGADEDDTALATEGFTALRPDVVVVCSPFVGYMDNVVDLTTLGSCLKQGSPTAAEAGLENPLSHLFLLATHAAEYISDDEVNEGLSKHARRVHAFLSKATPDALEAAAGIHGAITAETIRERMFPFFISENPDFAHRRLYPMADMRALLGEVLPGVYGKLITERLRKYRDGLVASYSARLKLIDETLADIDAAQKKIDAYDADADRRASDRTRLRKGISTEAYVFREECSELCDVLVRTWSDPRQVRNFIDSKVLLQRGSARA